MSALTREDLIDFEKAQVDLAKAKKTELALRKKIIGHFRYGDKTEGVVHKSVAGLDIDIAITLKMGRKLDKDALDAVWPDLTESQREAIPYKPSLDLKAYKTLVDGDEEGELINVVIETPALASIKLKFED